MSFNVAVIGVGLVGKEFISQLLSLPFASPFRLVSVSSSTRTYFSKQGLSTTNWQQALSKSDAKPDLPKLLTDLTILTPHGQGRAVVIDNTSSEAVAAFYPEFLKAGIDVITPNKKAWSGELSLWQKIDLATREGDSKILGEATVGAGLPIIGTLKDLVGTGDKISKIEGVLSGTLSYIFNEFSTVDGSGPSFSSVVKLAKEKGFTVRPAGSLAAASTKSVMGYIWKKLELLPISEEVVNNFRKVNSYELHIHELYLGNQPTAENNFPTDRRFGRSSRFSQEPHPADDLTGSDVARKLTILSRHIPSLMHMLPHGYVSVDTASLVPEALENIATGDEFLAKLPEFDAHFDQLRAEAAREGMVLRFVGVVDVAQKRIKAGLEKYPSTHPFATSLAGSDNIIAFHTERYSTRPLIVQGAGAGAAVTAAGVLGDLLHLV